MYFLNPTYLWAFLGLFVPLIIHLWGKKEGKIIQIGSTKLLSESDAKQISSIQLNEILLLLLRMLVLGILVLLMAQPTIKKNSQTIPVTYIIEPALLGTKQINAIVDTLATGKSLRLLAPGFPEYAGTQLDSALIGIPNYWQLAKEMETLQTDSIVVFANTFIAGIKGRRPRIRKNISWISFDRDQLADAVLRVIEKEDSLEVLSVHSDQHQLSYTKEVVAIDTNIKFSTDRDSVFFPLNGKQEAMVLATEKQPNVLICYTDSLYNEKRYIEASLKAIAKYTDIKIDIQSVQQVETSDFSEFDLIVWLTTDPIPTTATKILAYQPDHLADDLIAIGASNSIFYLTETLNAENSVARNLPEVLLGIFDFQKEVKKQADLYDKRMLSVAAVSPIAGTTRTTKKQPVLFDVSKWLWLLLLFVVVTERSVAKLRKQ